jgi:hypothetical protein
MGLLTRVLRLSGSTHGRPHCSSLSSLGDVVPQASFHLNQSDLLVLAKLLSALFNLE